MWTRRTTTGCVGLPGGYPVRVVPMPEQPSLGPVRRRPPGFPVPESVAPDLDVTASSIPCCRADAWIPGDRDRSRPPWMMGPALSWPARHSPLWVALERKGLFSVAAHERRFCGSEAHTLWRSS